MINLQLQVGENQLTSELSNDWPISLVVLELYNNELTGPIPVGFPNGLQILNLGSNRINGLFLGFTALCVLVFIASKVFRYPKMASKFGRKNSFGTLNSQNTSK